MNGAWNRNCGILFQRRCETQFLLGPRNAETRPLRAHEYLHNTGAEAVGPPKLMNEFSHGVITPWHPPGLRMYCHSD